MKRKAAKEPQRRVRTVRKWARNHLCHWVKQSTRDVQCTTWTGQGVGVRQGSVAPGIQGRKYPVSLSETFSGSKSLWQICSNRVITFLASPCPESPCHTARFPVFHQGFFLCKQYNPFFLLSWFAKDSGLRIHFTEKEVCIVSNWKTCRLKEFFFDTPF